MSANKTLSHAGRPMHIKGNEVRRVLPKFVKVRTMKQEVLNISFFGFAVRALRRGTLAHFPKTIRSAVSISKGSFKQESARVTNPPAMKPRRSLNINVRRIVPHRRVAGKLTNKSKPTGMTNGVLQFSFRDATKLPSKRAGSISNNARITVESPPQVTDVSSKERERPDTRQGAGGGPVLKEIREPTRFKEALPRT